MKKVRCTNTSCYLHNKKVETEATECLACGGRLKDDADIFLDNSGLSDLFKGA